MADTAIEWADVVWNPTTGCDTVSPGCDNCYARPMAKRLKAMGVEKYQTDGVASTSGPGFGIAMHENALALPLKWRKPRRVFVNSMSDLFHQGVSDEFIAKVFVVMALTPQHTYQILTKRHGRMRSLLSSGERWRNLLREADTWACFLDLPLPTERFLAVRQWIHGTGIHTDPVAPLPNVWLGVSVEDQKRADLRIPALLDTPAAVRWLSCEPLVGPVDLRRWLHYRPIGADFAEAPMPPSMVRACGLTPLDWVVVGGESGRGARPMHPDWARRLRDQCETAGVAFLFKQWGGRTPKAGGRELDGRTWDEYPERAA